MSKKKKIQSSEVNPGTYCQLIYHKEDKNILYIGKRTVSSVSDAGKLDSYM